MNVRFRDLWCRNVSVRRLYVPLSLFPAFRLLSYFSVSLFLFDFLKFFFPSLLHFIYFLFRPLRTYSFFDVLIFIYVFVVLLCICCALMYLLCYLCICCDMCVFVMISVYCCSYFRCRTAG